MLLGLKFIECIRLRYIQKKRCRLIKVTQVETTYVFTICIRYIQIRLNEQLNLVAHFLIPFDEIKFINQTSLS